MDQSARWHAVHDAVAAHAPADERERASRARVLTEMDRLPAPFSEDADPIHLTASGLVVGPRGTVLHLHRRMRAWLQPGGHIEGDESPWDAAVRETREETGLVACHPAEGPLLLHVDVHDAPKGHLHLDLRYLLHAPDEEPVPGPGESPDARWFTFEEADGVADESLRRALDAARRVIEPN
ncbi:MAG TPA: NUDIX domain-containing protein [Acidimicrobiia bacterium]|jgi:8-oxo-dGTP pyrophosphatase MutT (NUDIX family)